MTEVLGISHHIGGTLGNQRITISGKYFDFTDHSIEVTIAGKY